MRTIIRVKSRITSNKSLLGNSVTSNISGSDNIITQADVNFLSAAEIYDKLLAQLVKGHRLLSVPVHSIKRIAKDLCFTTIDNLTTIIEVQQVKGTATKKKEEIEWFLFVQSIIWLLLLLLLVNSSFSLPLAVAHH